MQRSAARGHWQDVGARTTHPTGRRPLRPQTILGRVLQRQSGSFCLRLNDPRDFPFCGKTIRLLVRAAGKLFTQGEAWGGEVPQWERKPPRLISGSQRLYGLMPAEQQRAA
jgi:hypothetical protein